MDIRIIEVFFRGVTVVVRLTRGLGTSHTDSETTVPQLTRGLGVDPLSNLIREIFLDLREPVG